MAADVRRRLLDALAGVRVACGISPGVWLRLRIVVQAHPLLVQFVRPPRDGARAEAFPPLDLASLPDHGAALAGALEAFAAGTLSALPGSGGEAAVAYSALFAGAGGLFAFVDPNDDLITLHLAAPGRSLGEATILGALADAPETLH